MPFRQLITGVILAGGKGTRMGGQDKGLVPLLGKPLYQYIAERLQPQVGQLMINANRNQARYRQSQLPVFSDLTEDFSGPLAGMQAALHQAKTEWLLFVPCDVPEFPRNLAEKMFHEKGEHLACYACDSEREHPTFALIHRSLQKPLDNYLARGDRKLMLFMREVHAKSIMFTSETETFANLNTPEDSRNWELQQK
ncbi:molybdopterin-guanine dinucleotide biosynthesis protein MobA [Providencia rustigianii]|uniref:Molybdenum cofactor guanylyltransferase n=2 Tax=Providencia rustigianii TaxID=158850 RepID=D1P0K6_9GAMM|nr:MULTISPECIES: molybdenum cofactor guanylyltransferase MobA [Providencia]EFB72875.1 molybdopterin-guanine dinucleotide biosynthesis protein A [Providencia rustigianii DSM 4541]MTC56332.1 molybdenum cofactor guanylyltransferase MobA [Providencia rustigianii]MTC59496.1 molybdenum cofactor guanylyltransferase MobA [Providencia rustigianii]SPY76239.1 molybdopterin-guanine dinucleotide biosynthesis protein MobA [Providencia rustigianii]SUC25412.1 molybdopterin-guanine dinucleotide biosynthesis pr